MSPYRFSGLVVALCFVAYGCGDGEAGVVPGVIDVAVEDTGADTTITDAVAVTDVVVDVVDDEPDAAPDPGPTNTEEVIDCEPTCDGVECGDDGCGGSCGACPSVAQCSTGQCVISSEAVGPSAYTHVVDGHYTGWAPDSGAVVWEWADMPAYPLLNGATARLDYVAGDLYVLLDWPVTQALAQDQRAQWLVTLAADNTEDQWAVVIDGKGNVAVVHGGQMLTKAKVPGATEFGPTPYVPEQVTRAVVELRVTTKPGRFVLKAFGPDVTTDAHPIAQPGVLQGILLAPGGATVVLQDQLAAVAGLNPQGVAPGLAVALQGTSFGEDAGTLQLGSAGADVVSWTPDSVLATMGADAQGAAVVLTTQDGQFEPGPHALLGTGWADSAAGVQVAGRGASQVDGAVVIAPGGEWSGVVPIMGEHARFGVAFDGVHLQLLVDWTAGAVLDAPLRVVGFAGDGAESWDVSLAADGTVSATRNGVACDCVTGAWKAAPSPWFGGEDRVVAELSFEPSVGLAAWQLRGPVEGVSEAEPAIVVTRLLAGRSLLYGPAPAPMLIAVVPAMAEAGATVELVGAALGDDVSGAQVIFHENSPVADVTWSGHTATVVVPAGATSGPARIELADGSATNSVFLGVADADADGDEVLDGVDNCPDQPNADQADLDDDGLGDVCDSDADGDGIAAPTDQLPLDPEQTKDGDGDGVADSLDNCPEAQNADQSDIDEDTVGDACDDDIDDDGVENDKDAFPADAGEDKDTDNDGTGDNADAFPVNPNEQKDTDKDGTGDNSDAFPDDPTEDTDTDNDGAGDNADVFPLDPKESADADGDGTGDNADCDDDNPAINAVAAEACDGIDNDCDGLTDKSADDSALAILCYTGPPGTQGKGACAAGLALCQDGAWGACSAEVTPTDEVCDGVDNDCNGVADDGDDGLALTESCYTGAPGTLDVGLCAAGSRACAEGVFGECTAQTLPVDEACDGKDNDCDGTPDDGCDDDEDGWCDADLAYTPGEWCPNGGGDTDDEKPTVFPDSPELCGNGLDDDGDGQVDEAGAQGCKVYFIDADTDGAGGEDFACLCAKTGAYTAAAADDCDDDNALARPGLLESCNGFDDNCDDVVDGPGAIGCTTFFADTDSDGWGDGSDSKCLCAAEGAYTSKFAGDCALDDAAVHPGAAEVCDTIDNDCNGFVDMLPGGIVLVKTCYTGPDGTDLVGACHGGIQVCSVGEWSGCIGEATPIAEDCNLTDDNCNGEVDEALTEACYPFGYSGQEAFWTVSPCAAGAKSCVDGAWTGCAGAVTPGPEICKDELDNDCDETTDEPGACASSCEGDTCDYCVGAGCPEGFGDGKGISVDESGNLILDVTGSTVDLPFMWVANNTDRTISKIDTVTGDEVARYNVGPDCVEPSRTALDEFGLVWVGCRNTNNLVLIANDKSQCIDKNKNGIIDTSSVSYDGAGNKTLYMLPHADDDCVLFNDRPVVPAGAGAEVGANPIPTDCVVGIRAVAVRKGNSVLFGGRAGCRDGHIWEGVYEYHAALPLISGVNPRVKLVNHWFTPSLTHTDWNGETCAFPYSNSVARSYGYAIDKAGKLWASSLESEVLIWVDLEKRTSCSFSVPTPYGISIDYAGRIWLGSWADDAPIAHVFIPETKKMFQVTQNTAGETWNAGTNMGTNQRTRGVVASADDSDPHAYLALSSDAAGAVRVKVTNEDPDAFDARVDGVLRTDGNGVCAENGLASGIGLDGAGDLWLIHMNKCGVSQFDGKTYDSAVALQIDPKSFTGWAYPTNAEQVKTYVKGIMGTGSATYTYSDFMGYQFATLVDPTGSLVQRFAGWGSPDAKYTTSWLSMSAVLVDASADPPLQLAYRVGKTEAGTTLKDFSAALPVTCEDLVCTALIPESLGTFIDVKLTLKTDSEGASVVIESLGAKGQRVTP